MSKQIKLSKNTNIDLQKLIDSRLLVQANSGGGKSWLLRRILEQSHGKVQQIVIDLEGEFSTLREKYDYVLAGKGGDTPATPQSAGLLARKLLELNVSAIIDLYELPHQDRKRFVRLFLESLINAPKVLWHPAMVIIDEAHVFAPEKGQSEAMEAVIDLATRGRKRGYCAVLATQRLSKLNKDAAAECNNKLIGRTGLDIDMKRAAEELGFTKKEQYLSLRSLVPGEFYIFGPALSTSVEKVKIGEVQTSHPKAGSRSLTKTVPPTDKIRRVLGKLADLPEEAKKEAKTLQEFKTQLVESRQEIRRLNTRSIETKTDPAVIERAIEKAVLAAVRKTEAEFAKKTIEFTNKIKEWSIYVQKLRGVLSTIGVALEKIKSIGNQPDEVAKYVAPKFAIKAEVKPRREQPSDTRPDTTEIDETNDTSKLGAMVVGERKILIAIAGDPEGITRNHITVLTGYKTTSRNEYVRRLKLRSYIEIRGERIVATQEGIKALGNDYEQLPTGHELQDHLMRTLPMGEKKILGVLLENYPNVISREEISEQTGYKITSRNEYLRRLNARRLIAFEGVEIKAVDNLFS